MRECFVRSSSRVQLLVFIGDFCSLRGLVILSGFILSFFYQIGFEARNMVLVYGSHEKMNARPGIVSINQSPVALPDLTEEGYINMRSNGQKCNLPSSVFFCHAL